MKDDAERGEGGEAGMRREGSTHHPVSIRQETFCLYEQSDMIHHGKGSRIYLTYFRIGDGQTFSDIHGAFVAKLGHHYISVFATPPGRHRIGWVGRFEVC